MGWPCLKSFEALLPKYWLNISRSKRKTLFFVFPKRNAIFLTSADGCNIHQAVIRFCEVGWHYYQLCWHLKHRSHQFDSPEEIGIFLPMHIRLALHIGTMQWFLWLQVRVLNCPVVFTPLYLSLSFLYTTLIYSSLHYTTLHYTLNTTHYALHITLKTTHSTLNTTNYTLDPRH